MLPSDVVPGHMTLQRDSPISVLTYVIAQSWQMKWTEAPLQCIMRSVGNSSKQVTLQDVSQDTGQAHGRRYHSAVACVWRVACRSFGTTGAGFATTCSCLGYVPDSKILSTTRSRSHSTSWMSTSTWSCEMSGKRSRHRARQRPSL